MSDATIIFFLCLCIVLLFAVVLYQQFVFRTGTQTKLWKIQQKLNEIIDTDSDERIMLFTENKALMELAAQINRLLENHLKVKADYRRSEIASKRMLSNISHDMKTPMTVILGYLEIMRLNGEATQEMLAKTEQKAQSVMELINQFFTLEKLEAGEITKEDYDRWRYNYPKYDTTHRWTKVPSKELSDFLVEAFRDRLGIDE